MNSSAPSPAPDPSSLRAIPSVDRAIRELGETGLPRPLLVAVVRRELEAVRAGVLASRDAPAGDVMPVLRAAVEDLRRARARGVINGTGVIIHTNLGRAPLAEAAVEAMTVAARDYSSLEYDLVTGERGGRGRYVETALATLCGAEAATVVNNCAAGLVLVLRQFVTAGRPEVVISRGELVQIGGGFRIPEILESSGATLREVGTTNRTSVEDYAGAVDDRTAMILKVHQSNFYMGGFVASVATEQLGRLARERGVPLVEDLGSGHVAGLEGVEHAGDEPTPASTVAAGADVVVFSGDKLFGGPQAGVIAGRAEYVSSLKRNPLFRALRCDKLVLAALEATVDLHLTGEVDEVPVLAMARIPCAELRGRAGRLVAGLAGASLRASVVEAEARIGGGSLPRTVIPSVALELAPDRGGVAALAARLRRGGPPVVGYAVEGGLRIDLRTVFPRQDESLLAAVRAAAAGLGA